MNNQSLILQVGLVCSTSLMNDSACHNGHKNGDQNIDLPDDRFFDNENMSVYPQLEFVCISVCLQLQFVCIDIGLQGVENLLR